MDHFPGRPDQSAAIVTPECMTDNKIISLFIFLSSQNVVAVRASYLFVLYTNNLKSDSYLCFIAH